MLVHDTLAGKGKSRAEAGDLRPWNWTFESTVSRIGRIGRIEPRSLISVPLLFHMRFTCWLLRRYWREMAKALALGSVHRQYLEYSHQRWHESGAIAAM